MLWQNMRKELITEGEVRSHLGEQGIDDPGEVKEAYMEGDGHISVSGKQSFANRVLETEFCKQSFANRVLQTEFCKQSLHGEAPRRQDTPDRRSSL